MSGLAVVAGVITVALAYAIDRRLRWEVRQRARSATHWGRLIKDYTAAFQGATEAIERMRVEMATIGTALAKLGKAIGDGKP